MQAKAITASKNIKMKVTPKVFALCVSDNTVKFINLFYLCRYKTGVIRLHYMFMKKLLINFTLTNIPSSYISRLPTFTFTVLNLCYLPKSEHTKKTKIIKIKMESKVKPQMKLNCHL